MWCRVFFLFSYWSSNTNSGTQKIWLVFLWQWVKLKYSQFWASFCLIDELDLFRTGREHTEDLVVKELYSVCSAFSCFTFVQLCYEIVWCDFWFFILFPRDQLQDKKGCSMPSYCAVNKSCKKLNIFQDVTLPETGPLNLPILHVCSILILHWINCRRKLISLSPFQSSLSLSPIPFWPPQAILRSSAGGFPSSME